MQRVCVLATVPQPTGEEIRDKLADIFARPEFSPQPDSLLSALVELLVAFFVWLGELHATAPVLFWVLLIGCIVLLLLLAAHITWTVRRVLFAGGRAASAAKGREERRRLSQSYFEEARLKAGKAEYTEAIRFLFLALVYRLDETGRVNFQQAYTNREYLGLFEDNPPLQGNLRVFVDILDDHWYGQQPTDLQHYQGCLALYETIT